MRGSPIQIELAPYKESRVKSKTIITSDEVAYCLGIVHENTSPTIKRIYKQNTKRGEACSRSKYNYKKPYDYDHDF